MTALGYDATRDERHKSARAYSAVAAWLKRRDLEGKAQRTLDDSERYTAELIREYPEKELTEYTHHDIEAFLATIPVGSRRKYRSHLAKLFEWAELEDLVDRNPMRRVARIQQPKQRLAKVYSDADVEALVSLPDPDGALYLLAFDAGPRSAEMRGLQVRDIHFERGIIAIRKGAKGDKHRLVPMTKRLQQRLAQWFLIDGLERDDFLWYMRRGGHEVNHDREIGPTSIKAWHARCQKAAGVRHHNLHSTRHTFATRALRRGISLTAVQRMLGHASVKTTSDEYVHLVIEDLAAELELLEV